MRPSPFIQALMDQAVSSASAVASESVGEAADDSAAVARRIEIRLRRGGMSDRQEDEIHAFVLTAMAQSMWAGTGFQRVNLGHKMAALMMSTNVPADVVAALDVPWGCFLLDVPAGLIDMTDVVPVTHALVSQAANGQVVVIGIDGSDAASASIATVFYVHTALADPARSRRLKALARLALGVCVELTVHRPSPRSVKAASGRRSHGSALFETPTYTITSDIKIDCREAVREYCRGAGRTSSKTDVQSFVRGYWKMQPHGPRNSQRRLQQISPHWRGDKTGPIALRSFILNGKQD